MSGNENKDFSENLEENLTEDVKERVAKRIAHLGYCSRREAEKLIREKKVKVNNVFITTAALLVCKADKISILGKVLKTGGKSKLYAYYKPTGLVCSNQDEKGRPTIFDDIYQNEKLERVVYVGRLDLNSEGLLLLTNNGEISKILSSPNLGLKRVYKVRAFGHVQQNALEELAMGIMIGGVEYRPILANIIKQSNNNVWIEFKINEGKNREIRNICEHLGLQVNRLIRTGFGPYLLEGMQESEIIEVDINKLKGVIPKINFEELIKIVKE
ncbi:rRNA pseudouridine synthase [Candidatus Hepatincolaceae symbiont of Richtersius coronifer]